MTSNSSALPENPAHGDAALLQRTSLVRYTSLVEHLPAIVYVAQTGSAGRWLYVSPRIEAVLGYSQEEWLNHPHPITSFAHPDDRERLWAEEDRSNEQGVPLKTEYRIRAKDGREVWVRDEAAMVFDEGGEPLFLQGLMLDVTEEKLAAAELGALNRRLKTLHDIDRAILAARSPEEIAHAALRDIADLVPCERRSLVLYDEPTATATWLTADETHPTSLPPGGSLCLGDEFPALAADGAAVASYPDIARAQDLGLVAFFRPQLLREDIRSLIVAPLVLGDRIIGSLNLSSRTPSAFGPEHVSVAEEVAAQLAIAITQATLRGELEASVIESREQVADLERGAKERRALLSRLVDAQEEERRRIAGEIHDGPIQELTALAMRLDLLSSRHPEVARDPKSGSLPELARSTITRLRELVFDLRPSMADGYGIEAAIRHYLDEQGGGEADPIFHVDAALSSEPSDQVRTVLYRIAMEALANTRKHASASQVHITMRQADDGFLVRVKDDGLGCDPAKANAHRPGHLGLAGMRERAELAGGWLRFESAPGEGTTVEFFVPEEASAQLVARGEGSVGPA